MDSGLVVVAIGWDEESTATMSLRPPHAGTAGETCVRDALGPVPAGLRAEGDIVHAVRR